MHFLFHQLVTFHINIFPQSNIHYIPLHSVFFQLRTKFKFIFQRSILPVLLYTVSEQFAFLLVVYYTITSVGWPMKRYVLPACDRNSLLR
jgi:hypothetical protein